MQTFFSSIQPSLKRYLIKKSLFFALPGFFLLLYMGIFLPLASIEKWGIWGFGLSFISISLGMIPYRRITCLETKPHRLLIERETLHFFHATKGKLSFLYEEIDQLSFVQKRGFYGIRLHLKTGKSFLLPYFSKKTFEKILHVAPLN